MEKQVNNYYLVKINEKWTFILATTLIFYELYENIGQTVHDTSGNSYNAFLGTSVTDTLDDPTWSTVSIGFWFFVVYRVLKLKEQYEWNEFQSEFSDYFTIIYTCIPRKSLGNQFMDSAHSIIFLQLDYIQQISGWMWNIYIKSLLWFRGQLQDYNYLLVQVYRQ